MSEYTGPDFCIVNAIGDDQFEIRSNRGELIGIYPQRMIERIVANWERAAMRRYLKKGD